MISAKQLIRLSYEVVRIVVNVLCDVHLCNTYALELLRE